MAKKSIATLLALTLLTGVLFCGCSMNLNSKKTIDVYDPATEMVADVAGKAVKSEEKYQSGDFEYILYQDDTACITAYNGEAEVLEIPGEIEGYTVIGVENKSFFKKDSLKEVVLADSIAYVGNYAFLQSKNIEKVSFGKDIKIIGVSAFDCGGDNTHGTGYGKLQTIVWNGAPEIICKKAFYYADKLTEIVLPEGVKEIREWAFAKCSKADKIIISEGVERIDNHAFLKCYGAKEIYIPSTCKEIGMSAFYNATSLENLTVSEGVEHLDKGTFEGASALKTVTLPKSIKTMDPYIFYNCTALEECHLGNVEFMDKDIFTGDANVTVFAPADSVPAQYAKTHHLAFKAQ